MKLRQATGAVAAGILTLSLVAAHEGVETRDFVMNGAQEVDADGPAYKGDPMGQARAHVSIPEDDGTAICLHLEITKELSDGAGDFIGLHLHEAERGEVGPVTVQLSGLLDDLREDGVIDACIDNPTDASGAPVAGSELADIVLDGRDRFTDEYYLNLHTENYPAGALRGQVKGENYRPVEGPRGRR